MNKIWAEGKSISYTEEDLKEVAALLLRELGDETVWLFDAPMGAGKTTLIRELCSQLGVAEEVNSPTFAIVNEYHRANGDPLYHFDAYRLERVADLENIGASEYLYSGYYTFVEWPGLFAPILPTDGVARLRIDLEGDRRRLSMEPEGSAFIYDPR